MDQLYLIVIAGLVVAGLVMLAVFKPDLAKKYWGIIAAVVAAIVGLVFLFGRGKSTGPTSDSEDFARKEVRLRKDLEKVHEDAERQIDEAKAEEQEVLDEVEEIKSIEDDAERLARISDLFNRTRRR